MELNELKTMWQSYDSKLETSLKLNLRCLDLIQTHKVKSQLGTLLCQRWIELGFHTVAIGLLLAFLINNFADWRYTVSAISLLVFYVLAFVACLKQIMVIRRMDYSDDIITIQSSLLMLQTHMVNSVRLAILCIPTFLAFPMVVSKAIADLHLTGLSFMDIAVGYKGDWWTVQLYASLGLLPFCIWLFAISSHKHIHIKWVRDTIKKVSGVRIARAFEFVNELQALKKELI